MVWAMGISEQKRERSDGNRSVSRPKKFSIKEQLFDAPPVEAGLYIVSTPIGNLGDITLRALETLASVDLIACEDTRMTRRLLERYGIQTRLMAYHDRNGPQKRPQLLAELENGGSIALVSDAGTPLVSDPGYKLVREASSAGHSIVAIPGASALLGALVTSALPSDRFLFEGFLPNRSAKRKSALKSLVAIDATLVFYESPRRLAATLADMVEILGNREAALARELTKKFEETLRLPLAELADHYRDAATPKGEIVIVVGPPTEAAVDPRSAEDMLRAALPHMSVREAASEIAGQLKRPRREIYALAITLSKKDIPEKGNE